jgi:N-acetylglucosamine kinase-like BadF-type ATPase
VGRGWRPVTGGLPAVLAVDGGNSKTDVALVAADGTLLASVRGAGWSGSGGAAGCCGLLAELVRQAQRQAGHEGGAVARHLSACIANADLPEEEQALAVALAAQGWTETVTVVNDTFAVLRAGLEQHRAVAGPPAEGGAGPWGAAVTCGAGINCVGVAPDGRSTGFLALGSITGDWGGGPGLGRAALWHAMRAEDGRGPATALAAAVAGHFGLRAVRDVALGLHLGSIAYGELRHLCPVVFTVAAGGDPIAASLVRRQADEIVVMALTVLRRLGLTDRPVPVVLGGGMLAARPPELIAQVQQGIAVSAPLARVLISELPPVAGAALLGLDHSGAGTAAQQRLCQAAYAAAPTGSGQRAEHGTGAPWPPRSSAPVSGLDHG